jgi:hypothetical protein
MAVQQEGSNVVINRSVAGSVFPTSERELVFPVLIDGSEQAVHIGGSVYGRSLALRGQVRVHGPVVARGDTVLQAGQQRIQLDSGLTINGSLNCRHDPQNTQASLQAGVQTARVVVKGDIAVNQGVYLRDAIVFGSIRATHCVLENSLVLGTCLIDETLKVRMSTIGGYVSRDIAFEGHCVMLHSLGESLNMPVFAPHESTSGTVLDADVRYYPAIRHGHGLMNRLAQPDVRYPSYARLYPQTDWVRANTLTNPALYEDEQGQVQKWVLSIGGRISDISKISEAVVSLTQMLKCGFEFEHYAPSIRQQQLQRALAPLTDEERWILQTVCDTPT